MQRVRRQVGEVGNAELFQGTDQHFRTDGGVERVSIGLEFMSPGEDIENDWQHHADGRIEKAEKDQTGVNGDVFHLKRGKQAAVVDKQG